MSRDRLVIPSTAATLTNGIDCEKYFTPPKLSRSAASRRPVARRLPSAAVSRSVRLSRQIVLPSRTSAERAPQPEMDPVSVDCLKRRIADSVCGPTMPSTTRARSLSSEAMIVLPSTVRPSQ